MRSRGWGGGAYIVLIFFDKSKTGRLFKYCIGLYCMVRYGVVLCCVVLCCIELHCIVLYCTVL